MELLHRLLCAAMGVASIFYFFVKATQSHWAKRGILHKKPEFLIGNMKGVGQKLHIAEALRRLYDEFKGKAPFIGFYTYLSPMLLVLDIDLVKRILSEDANNFLDRGLYNNVVNDPLSANLMQLDGASWQELHAKLKAVFEADKVEVVLPALLRVAATFERSLSTKLDANGEVFDVNRLVECFNLDAVSRLAVGLEGDSIQFLHTEFRQVTRSYFKHCSLLKAYLALTFPYVARLLHYCSYDQQSSEYFEKLVQDTMRDRGSKQRYHGEEDYLNIFADLTRNSDHKKRLRVAQIAPQSFSFILVGLDACNATMAFCLYELALQPKIQQRTHQEIVDVLRRHNGQLTLKSLKEMQYLRQVLCETLRKHSPYPFLLRQTIKDYEVPDSVFMLKEGNTMVIPTAAIHLDPDFYPLPHTFDPDRFHADAIKARHPMTWLPFGVGPRSCIAQHLAETQMLIGLVSLLKLCRFSPCAETSIPLKYDNSKLLLTPSIGIQLRVERL